MSDERTPTPEPDQDILAEIQAVRAGATGQPLSTLPGQPLSTIPGQPLSTIPGRGGAA